MRVPALVTLAFAAVQTATMLVAGGRVERELRRGEAERFSIALEASELASVTIEQRGIDVRAVVRNPDGTLLEDAVDALGASGEEHIEFVAAAPGTYTITVTPADGGAAGGQYAIRVDGRRPANAVDLLLQDARSLRTRAHEFERAGHYDEARSLFEQALEIREECAADDETAIAELLFELAGNALEREDNGRSRAFYERALGMFDRAWGAGHPYSAMTRSRLALLDERAGQRQKSETEIRQVLPVLERALGTDHPWYVLSLVTLGKLRASAGDLQEAESIARRGLSAVERTGQTGTIVEAALLNDLADILRAKGEYAAAGPMFARSLAIGESVVGADSLFVATALQNLGILARERKDYTTAVAYYQRAIVIRERLQGADHPGMAPVLMNLANIYRATGDYRRALDTHFRALRLWEASVGPYAQETLLVVGNIARTYAGVGDIENALAFQRRADVILETQMTLYLATGSERQKLAFVRSVAERTDRTLSLHLRQAPDNRDAAAQAALVLLQRKGRVDDAMTDLFATVRQRVTDPDDRALLDAFKEATAELSRAALGHAPRASIAKIEARREQLETALSSRSTEFRAELQPASVERVQAAIPGDAALFEFAVFRPFDPQAERNDEAYGPPHYAAYVMSKHGMPAGVDLGTVEDIDRLVTRLRDGLRDPGTADIKARARALDDRIMRPLRPLAPGATRLLISPDGALNLVPFEALVDERGRYLIQRYSASYVTSGRDLLRLGAAPAPDGRPVIVADPLFGEPAAASAGRPHVSTHDARRSVTAAAETSALYFAPLSGSAIEGRAIKSLLPDAQLLTGGRATKDALERMSGPSILHIASHGFFLTGDHDPEAAFQNPLLRSGIALAGANLPDRARGGGILTALEAAGLDLWGTELVTLSACDTAIGEIHNGEGVYGLRRAFTLAGADSLVMSLWPVNDAVARDTMVSYYVRLRVGASRGEALRQTKLAMLKRATLRHPYYWAAFIQSGDWTRLRAH